MAEPKAERPAICLNMIVRNEAHIVSEMLDSVAPYIKSWVVVDTGSDDGTQELVQRHMAALGIPGELHERPWRNFGHNRTEALTLAQGHGDYIWVMDADDVLVGKPDFSALSADVYRMRYRSANLTYWYPLVFRDGLGVRYQGVTHEHPRWDGPDIAARIGGEYHIEDRQRSYRNISGKKHENDRDLLLAEVKRDPADARSVFYLAESYFALGDFAEARTWYARRVEMGGWAEEVYYAMFRIAESMTLLGVAWPEIQDAYLRAWACRPIRAEPLYAIACQYRLQKSYHLGYLFAEGAAQIPLPEQDSLLVNAAVHAWAAADEQANCAFNIGRQAEAFTLWRRLLARRDLPDEERRRIAINRDFAVPTMLEVAAPYPEALAGRLDAGGGAGDVTVSLIAGPDVAATERTLNSFLNCCRDVSQVARFLVIPQGIAPQDRARLRDRYRFLEFGQSVPGTGLAQIRHQIDGRFWLRLGAGWRFFAPEDYITRLTAVLEAEPEVVQVGINIADASRLTGTCAPEDVVRRAGDTGRYVLTDTPVGGPAMFDTTRLDRTNGLGATDAGPFGEPDPPAPHTGIRAATLDEVLCIAPA